MSSLLCPKWRFPLVICAVTHSPFKLTQTLLNPNPTSATEADKPLPLPRTCFLIAFWHWSVWFIDVFVCCLCLHGDRLHKRWVEGEFLVKEWEKPSSAWDVCALTHGHNHQRANRVALGLAWEKWASAHGHWHQCWADRELFLLQARLSIYLCLTWQ